MKRTIFAALLALWAASALADGNISYPIQQVLVDEKTVTNPCLYVEMNSTYYAATTASDANALLVGKALIAQAAGNTVQLFYSSSAITCYWGTFSKIVSLQ